MLGKKTVTYGKRLPADLAEYIKGIKFRRKLLGVSEEDVWALAYKLQVHYEEEVRRLQSEMSVKDGIYKREHDEHIRSNSELEALRSENMVLRNNNDELRHKLMWIISKIRDGSRINGVA